MNAQSRQPARSNGWQNIKTESGKLLSRYHPIKNLLEFKVGGLFYYVDLDEYRLEQSPMEQGDPTKMRIATGLLRASQ